MPLRVVGSDVTLGSITTENKESYPAIDEKGQLADEHIQPSLLDRLDRLECTIGNILRFLVDNFDYPLTDQVATDFYMRDNGDE